MELLIFLCLPLLWLGIKLMEIAGFAWWETREEKRERLRHQAQIEQERKERELRLAKEQAELKKSKDYWYKTHSGLVHPDDLITRGQSNPAMEEWSRAFAFKFLTWTESGDRKGEPSTSIKSRGAQNSLWEAQKAIRDQITEGASKIFVNRDSITEAEVNSLLHSMVREYIVRLRQGEVFFVPAALLSHPLLAPFSRQIDPQRVRQRLSVQQKRLEELERQRLDHVALEKRRNEQLELLHLRLSRGEDDFSDLDLLESGGISAASLDHRINALEEPSAPETPKNSRLQGGNQLQFLKPTERRRIGVNELAIIRDDAIRVVHKRLLIISPWAKWAVVNDAMSDLLEEALGRGVQIDIGLGNQQEDLSDSDPKSIDVLDQLRRRFPAQFRLHKLWSHEKLLIVDYAVVTGSLNWLSRGKNSHSYKQSENGEIEVNKSWSDDYYAETLKRLRAQRDPKFF